MLAAMAFLARYNYLSRIGALSPMPINALLKVDAPPSLGRFRSKCKHRFEPDDLALLIRSPQTARPTQIQHPGKPPAQKIAKKSKSKAGKLPEWNLADLYSGIDAPEVTRDLDRMDAECVAFETDYKGKLAEETAAEGGGNWLAEAVRRYEAIDDLAGRLGSYAGLVHAGDSVDPAISKFYGDVSERLTTPRCICCSSRSSSTASTMP